MKKALIGLPVPVLLITRGWFTLDTDACDKRSGCVLFQRQEQEITRPAGYWSRTFYDEERKLGTAHRERLAVIWIVTLLRPCLGGTRLTLRTDHEALQLILTKPESTEKLPRSRLRLSEFKFDILYRAGIKTQAADTLSRLSTNGEEKSPLHDEVSDFTNPQEIFAYV